MTEPYEMHSTSRQSAIIKDRVLSETGTTRLVLRPEVVSNPKDPHAGVKITLIHQRKKAAEGWVSEPAEPLSALRAGEMKKLTLDSEKTLKLFDELQNLYAISSTGGVRPGDNRLVVGREQEIVLLTNNRARIINLLLQKDYPEEVWKALTESKPDLATKLSYAQIQVDRKNALNEFDVALKTVNKEDWWANFFERNTWVFGYGLNYKFLRLVCPQPNYGGSNFRGKGSLKGDSLHRTEGALRFTVLVEIKRPDTALLGKSNYRNGAWELGTELSGGVSQVQASCLKWETEGSTTEQNREILHAEKTYTVRPKGILVIGSTAQLTGDIDKRTTFELFRRNLVNPEILTFDELYERARFIVERSSMGELAAGGPA
ncbi:MAG: DUF4263 domain-containing protein [Acidobacteria bacterium]|nr:DUF4263 domain-containing protein [Acidobacteriota bacterium]